MHFYSVKVNYYEDETAWNPYSLSRISLQTLTGGAGVISRLFMNRERRQEERHWLNA